MSYWALISSESDGSLHVVPTDKHGTRILNGHTMSEDCWCQPEPDSHVPEMLVHNDHQLSHH